MEYFNDLAWLLTADQKPFIPTSRSSKADNKRIQDKIKSIKDTSVILPNRKNTTKPASIVFFHRNHYLPLLHRKLILMHLKRIN